MHSVDLSVQQSAYKVVPGFGPALLYHVEEISAHLCLRVGASLEARSHDGVRPGFEPRSVFVWDAQHLGDDDYGQRVGQVIYYVHTPGRDYVVEQFIDD